MVDGLRFRFSGRGCQKEKIREGKSESGREGREGCEKNLVEEGGLGRKKDEES